MTVFWLKNDLRLDDNDLLALASKTPGPILILFIYESLRHKHSSWHERDHIFLSQTISELKTTFASRQIDAFWLAGDTLEILQDLHLHLPINALYSYQEVGHSETYKRDKHIRSWSTSERIPWIEVPKNGIIRGLINRDSWPAHLDTFADVSKWQPTSTSNITCNLPPAIHQVLAQYRWEVLAYPVSPQVQPGGESFAHKYLQGFTAGRISAYSSSLSKPEESRYHCSRLSPYLAIGSISVKRALYEITQYQKQTGDKFNAQNVISRFRWRSHFIQKFESESSMEFEPVNKGFLNVEWTTKSILEEAYLHGYTGIPAIDAAMRCLNQTGYVNFRSRAMLVSFATHVLRLDWRITSEHLGKQWLDYEVGIHIPQVQMQSSLTGINTVRIYNPIKQQQDHDPNATFVKKWVPELQSVTAEQINSGAHLHEATHKVYPPPLVDLKVELEKARVFFWALQKDKKVVQEAQRILARHTTKERFA